MSRDSQFQEFAKLLLKELIDSALDEYGLVIEGREQYADLNHDLTVCEEIIARRAYDLVKHTIENTAHIDLDRELPENHALLIPDMTELPKESNHE